MHSAREWHHFYELTWLRSPWEPLAPATSATLELWHHGALTHWTSSTLELWHSGVLAHWSSGTLELWHIGALARWSSGTLELWHIGALAHWSSGTLELWHIGVLAHWSSGTLEFWHIGARVGGGYHFPAINVLKMARYPGQSNTPGLMCAILSTLIA